MTQKSKITKKELILIIVFFLPVLSTILTFLGYKTVSAILFSVWFIPYFLLALFVRKLKDYTDRKAEERKRRMERIEAEQYPNDREKPTE